MNQYVKGSIFLIGLCVALGVNAEQKSPADIDITGTWKLEAARPKLEVKIDDDRNKRLEDTPFKYLAGEDKKKSKEIWKFTSNGDFEITFDDPRASGSMTSKSTYIVEGDSLKIAIIGRTGKFDRYKVLSIEGNKMTLKGGMEGYYFFSK
jgi:hypothetical protein